MRLSARLIPATLLALCCAIALFFVETAAAQTVAVGQGAPNDYVRGRFIATFYSGNFSAIAGLPPEGAVRTFGTGGFVQEFPDISKTPARSLAIVHWNGGVRDEEGNVEDTFQMRHPMWAYYSGGSLGPNVAGFPLSSTDEQRIVDANGVVVLQYQVQTFQKNYVLFSWLSPPPGTASTNFAVREPFFTRWRNNGGLSILGPAIAAEAAFTSRSGTIAGTQQEFYSAYLFSMTAGPSSGRVVTVREPIYSLYKANGGPTGSLGFPVNDELFANNSRRRQSFEGGSIEYAPGQAPVVRPGVQAIDILQAGTIRLNLNDTANLDARMLTLDGQTVTDREVSWTTTNSRVVRIEVAANNTSRAVLRAVGGGSAFVTATSEGKTSTPLTVFVSAPCCQVGEGAPTAAIQQAFTDAVARNRLNLRLPAPNPVRRFGNGFLQEFASAADGSRLLLAKPDSTAQAFLLAEPNLSAWEPRAAILGYPVSDATLPGGRQLFENQIALSGNPPLSVAGPVLTRWAQLGYETGILGQPAASERAILSFTAVPGVTQEFANGLIVVALAGAQANRAYFVNGLIGGGYLAQGGPNGALGFPTTDEFQAGALRRQEFEGGSLFYAAGSSELGISFRERRPNVVTSPATVVAGNRVRLAVGGFEPGSRLRISVAGRPDFEVDTESGAFAWDVFVAPGTASGVVVVRASVVGNPGAAATGSYTVRGLADTRFTISKLRGDTQTGAPAAVLPVPLRVLVRDEFGSVAANFPVTFNASPGSEILGPRTVNTGANGEAEVRMRLASAEGVALATAEAGRAVTTFSFRIAPRSLADFPKITQTGAKDAMVAATASILRYLQIRGELAAPNGPVDAAIFGAFLRDQCVFDARNERICDSFFENSDLLNPWRAGSFTGGGVDVAIETPTLEAIRDRVSSGVPVLLALGLTRDGVRLGSHFLAATGITGDGSIAIHDPNPAINQGTLDAYLAGFPFRGGTLKGELTGALRYAPRAPQPTAFLVHGNSPLSVVSPAGTCSPPLRFSPLAAVITADSLVVPDRDPGLIHLAACDGGPDPYQFDLSAGEGVFTGVFTALGQPAQRAVVSGVGSASYRIRLDGGQYQFGAQNVEIDPGAITNAASAKQGLAPEGLAALRGSGLVRSGEMPTLEVNGTGAAVVFASPFQVNFQIPAGIAPGPASVRIQSAFGQATQTAAVLAVAPALFPAAANPDGRVNGVMSPVRRGQVLTLYGTGLGRTQAQGSLRVVESPVTCTIGGRPAVVSFAGLAPSLIGVYQVNVVAPMDLAPGLNLPLQLGQAGSQSNTIEIAVE
jgi:uncharacterized protein (TIGR03437 family)